MFKMLLRVALAYAAYKISREFVRTVPDIERGPLGEAPPRARRTAGKSAAPRKKET